MRVLTIIGARPQFVKAAAFRKTCDEMGVDETLLHTGQHYDPEMSTDIFKELLIKPPEINMVTSHRSQSLMTGELVSSISSVIQHIRPELVAVFGDTTSTLAGAIAANKENVPVAHIEAGLRSFDKSMPEEINRILTDHVSSLLFCPTTTAVKNLGAESICSNVFHVGDIMYDAVRMFSDKFRLPEGYVRENGRKLGIVTIHRNATLSSRDLLEKVLNFCSEFAHEYQLIFPVHPHTLKKINEFDLKLHNFEVINPVSYLEMQGLLSEADMLLTDSGGLQKEAYFHAVDCITLRNETEWTETVEAGWNRLWTFDKRTTPKTKISEYGIGNTSEKIIDIIQEFQF